MIINKNAINKVIITGNCLVYGGEFVHGWCDLASLVIDKGLKEYMFRRWKGK